MTAQHTWLITGGAGFIGSALVSAAIAQGHRVVVLDKLTYAGHRQNLEWIDGPWELVVADVADADAVRALFAAHTFDAVIHAAAESHVDNSIAGAGAFMRSNVLGTQVLLDAALAQWQARGKPEHFRYLQVSTDEVYGALGATGHFTLDSPLAPNSPYAASKASADLLVRAWHKTHGLPTLITRCCNNYGPRQHPEKLIPRMISNALAGQPLPVYGDGQQMREWIHVDDHAAGVLAVLARGDAGGIYHLGSGVESRNLDLVHRVCDELSACAPGADYRSLITHVTDRLGHDFRYALDVEPTRKKLGFAARIGFAEGLRDTVRWYAANPPWITTMLAHKQAVA
ncbi:MAG: dTDP-glucose 4,6-dehydratase [Azospirillum brasilense]|nr:MAG: dTDP-glucose 4,6-dehydratase [Azospirillum brasilense]